MNMTSKLIALGGAALLFGAAAHGFAQGGHQQLQAFDRDNNGVLSSAELDQVAAETFARADADRDGRVTHAELLTLHGPAAGAGHGNHAGAGGDGAMTLAAFRAHVRERASTADANRDGQLSLEEAAAMHRARHGGN